MTTQNNIKTLRTNIPKLMSNIQILYQNGEITSEEKNRICKSAKDALLTNDTSDLHKEFKSIRYGSLFPDVIDDCIQLIS